MVVAYHNPTAMQKTVEHRLSRESGRSSKTEGVNKMGFMIDSYVLFIKPLKIALIN